MEPLPNTQLYTTNEGPMGIQYKCLVHIYVFPEIKQYYNVLCSNSYTHVSVRDLHISRIGLPILLQEICGPILEYIHKSLTDTWMRKMGLRPRNSQKKNKKMGFSLQCTDNICVAHYVSTQHYSATNHWKSERIPTRRNCGCIKRSKVTLCPISAHWQERISLTFLWLLTFNTFTVFHFYSL